MKNRLFFLLLCMFVSVPALADGNEPIVLKLKGIGIGFSVDSHERSLFGNRDIPSVTEMLVPSPRVKEKDSPFEALGDHPANGLDIKARTYRFTGHLSFGRVEGNFLGHGVGLTYRINGNSSVACAVSYDRAKGTSGLAIVFSSVFF